MKRLQRLFYIIGAEKIGAFLEVDVHVVHEWARDLVGFPAEKVEGTLVAKKSEIKSWKKQNMELIQKRQEIINALSWPVPTPPRRGRLRRW